ncbi:hypothetical protein V1478_016275 [Vespula squamosa]|uniref:Uncharacterized protein n=1 Tax=Vespula squamosa TaxID=30214 RepID=A0ABD1ZZC0_VESSQ
MQKDYDLTCHKILSKSVNREDGQNASWRSHEGAYRCPGKEKRREDFLIGIMNFTVQWSSVLRYVTSRTAGCLDPVGS